MDDLETVLRSVSDRIGRYRYQTIGKACTKNVPIEPERGAAMSAVSAPGA